MVLSFQVLQHLYHTGKGAQGKRLTPRRAPPNRGSEVGPAEKEAILRCIFNLRSSLKLFVHGANGRFTACPVLDTVAALFDVSCKFVKELSAEYFHKKVPSATFTPCTKPLMLTPITAQAGQACTATGGNLGHG